MGEVFLAFDPICERQVALKCMRADLKHKKAIQTRFLREAKIASQLTHPSIIPIYAIHEDKDSIYYTMSYVEGETLKEILHKTSQQIKKGLPLHPIGQSIPSLSRLFLRVCEAIYYTHNKGILHRDLKPDNIIIGKFGEVMILDWGIADYLSETKEEAASTLERSPDITRPGRVAGTVSYMAPERAMGKEATIKTDIYSLGAILFQLLTLHPPFHRGNLQAFRKTMKNETLPDPIEMAPYREIPNGLAQIAKKCLAFDPDKRPSTVQELIDDVKNIIEGKAEWLFVSDLSMEEKEDWEFEENVLFAKHTAISRQIEQSEWVSLMISKESFSENMKIEIEITVQKGGQGVGLLFSIPEATKRKSLEEGYCLWMGSSNFPGFRLFRSNVLVLELLDIQLPISTLHKVVIEKINDHLIGALNGTLIFTYSTHLPLAGGHVGLLYKDADFSVKHCKVFSGTSNVMVGCLAVPDAFFTHKDFDMALIEYRKIGKCFPGRAEGREALFRAGMTLLEKAKWSKDKKEKIELFDLAYKEFENLNHTPGAPLEYMGKSMVYEARGDSEEEVKCLELALRKFPKHPLLPILEEHILYRMHESSHQKRDTAYRLILTAIRYFPKILKNKEMQNLLHSLQKHWQDLFFIEEAAANAYTNQIAKLAIILAFWTNKKQALVEIIKSLCQQAPYDQVSIENALFCLLELGYNKDLKEMLLFLKTKPMHGHGLELISTALLAHYRSISSSLKDLFTHKKMGPKEGRALHHILQLALIKKETASFQEVYKNFRDLPLKQKPFLDSLFVWNALLTKNFSLAEEIFHAYPMENLHQESHPLFIPYGAYLYVTENPEMATGHFSSLLDTPLSTTASSLAAHYITGRPEDKKMLTSEAFYWEKMQLFKELTLFFRVIGDEENYKQFEKKLHHG